MRPSTCALVFAAAAACTHPSFALATPQKLALKYFDLRGAAETCRVLFALGGEDYSDCRYSFDSKTFKSEAFDAAKENGEHTTNLDRAPVLLMENGSAVGQSKAIERYLARRFDLMGDSPEEEVTIDCIAEHCRDVKDAAMRKSFSAFAKGKTDEEKAEARKEWFETDLPAMLKKVDASVLGTGNGVFAVGKKMSYADVAIWSLLRECAPADKDDTTKAAAECSALNAIADAIASNTKVSSWVAERPVTIF